MNYRLYRGKEVMLCDGLRIAFNTLAEKTFQLSFEHWYQDGYWTFPTRCLTAIPPLPTFR